MSGTDPRAGLTGAAGVLLAAGAGVRYGGPKVLAHNGLWLRHAVTALRDGGCCKVFVVLGAASTELPPGATAVSCPQWRTGLAASLRAGLAAVAESSADLAVLHLVDLPDVGADVVARVLAAAGESGLARAVYGHLPGHPVVLHRRYWQLASDAAQGDRGANAFLAGRDDLVLVQCADLASGLDTDHRQVAEIDTDHRQVADPPIHRQRG